MGASSRVGLSGFPQHGFPRGLWRFLAAERRGLGHESEQRSDQQLSAHPFWTRAHRVLPACASTGGCSVASAVTGTGANTITNPFPGRNHRTSRDAVANYAQALLGNGINENQLRNPYGYAQQWNADVQQQLGNGFLIDVAYGGAKGTHLPIDSPQIDQLPDQYLSLGSALLKQCAESVLRNRHSAGLFAGFSRRFRRASCCGRSRNITA